MITYAFLQHYWWFLISLLGGLLAFLLFVQGGQSMLFSLPGNDGQKKVMLSVLGRKWEYTFTTLVTFGGALFASFPLFYSTSFGGAYWLWMLILLSFVLQAVSYEFRSRPGNVFGTKTYDIFLFINGLLGTLLVGVVIGTFFTGSDFTVARDNITTVGAPVISRWGNAWHGLESIANLRNLCLHHTAFCEYSICVGNMNHLYKIIPTISILCPYTIYKFVYFSNNIINCSKLIRCNISMYYSKLHFVCRKILF